MRKVGIVFVTIIKFILDANTYYEKYDTNHSVPRTKTNSDVSKPLKVRQTTLNHIKPWISHRINI